MATGGRTPFENIRLLGFATNYPDLIGSKDIHVALRTDGQVGSGTKLDPFNCSGDIGLTGDALKASAAAKLTLLHTTYQLNYNFHYAAGTYYTYGYLAGVRRTTNPGCKHFGAGIDQTIIKLFGATDPNEGTIFGSVYNVRSDSFEVHDMTLDADAVNQPRWTGATPRGSSCLNVRGSKIWISRAKVIGFGARNGECFPLSAIGYQFAGDFSDNIIEDCVATAPATGNTDGVSCITAGFSNDTGLTQTGSRNIVRRNRVVLDGNDFTYSHGADAPLTEDNYISGCSDGFYVEPPYGNAQLKIVRNNIWQNCTRGFGSAAHIGAVAQGFIIQGNQAIDCTYFAYFADADTLIHYDSVTLVDNQHIKSDGTAYSSMQSLVIGQTTNVTIRNNIFNNTTPFAVDVYNSSAIDVAFNKTAAGKLCQFRRDSVAKRQEGEIRVTFTPSAAGWYRLVSGSVVASGYVRLSGNFDGRSDDTIIYFASPGYGGSGQINQFQLTNFAGYTSSSLFSQFRTSNNNSDGVYLDVYIPTATAPAPVTVVFGSEILPSYVVSNPVASFPAASGGFGEIILPVGKGLRTSSELSGRKLIATTAAAPTVTAGAGAGTSPTVSITGTDIAGEIVVTTGSAPTGSNATIVTITFNSAYASTVRVLIGSSNNTNSAALSGATQVFAFGGTNTFLLKSGTSALSASTQYKWTYHVIG